MYTIKKYPNKFFYFTIPLFVFSKLFSISGHAFILLYICVVPITLMTLKTLATQKENVSDPQRKLIAIFILTEKTNYKSTGYYFQLQTTTNKSRRKPAALSSNPKSRNGAEKKGLWSLSKTYTSAGGHRFIISSC